jgi:hypothetical protein
LRFGCGAGAVYGGQLLAEAGGDAALLGEWGHRHQELCERRKGYCSLCTAQRGAVALRISLRRVDKVRHKLGIYNRWFWANDRNVALKRERTQVLDGNRDAETADGTVENIARSYTEATGKVFERSL